MCYEGHFSILEQTDVSNMNCQVWMGQNRGEGGGNLIIHRVRFENSSEVVENHTLGYFFA